MSLRQAYPVKPSLNDIISLHDFEQVASQTLSKKSWAYISSGSYDNITRDTNLAILRKIWLRPAVMRNVQKVNTKTTLFGCQLDLPIFIAPTLTIPRTFIRRQD